MLYQIPSYELPFKERICDNCKEVIGGKYYKLSKQTDYRIFYNEEIKNKAIPSFKEAKVLKFNSCIT